MPATILSIGDELASGLTTNTNASWLAQQLASVGIAAALHVTVPDQIEPIVAAIREALATSDLILISGGLGPTEDDLTRPALAAVLNEPLVEDATALAQLTAWFASRKRPLSPSNLVQARRPASATCIENTTGTAPGLAYRAAGKLLFVMPGVPREMMEMFTLSILPALQVRAGDRVTLTHKLHTFGLGESLIGERIADLMARGGVPNMPGATVGTTVHDGIVSVRIYATAPSARAREIIAQLREVLHARLGALIFGEQDDTLESAVGSLLKQTAQTVATAESCTGGLIATLLTETSGSSAYFLRGYVTYSNAAKSDDLHIDPAIIAAHGAVSEPVALAMAEGARTRAQSTHALSTTGIAGPDGGTANKPVGTVWMALATPAGTTARRFIFPGNRAAVRLRAAQMALTLLRLHLLGLNPADVLK
jgi:nicotinamide-nucleotide amidase